MNYSFQRKQVRPTAKSCFWCQHCHECCFNTRINHRLFLKAMREHQYRYCKNYRYSKINFKKYKQFCKENEAFYQVGC